MRTLPLDGVESNNEYVNAELLREILLILWDHASALLDSHSPANRRSLLRQCRQRIDPLRLRITRTGTWLKGPVRVIENVWINPGRAPSGAAEVQ